jgi:hypothetical protein
MFIEQRDGINPAGQVFETDILIITATGDGQCHYHTKNC